MHSAMGCVASVFMVNHSGSIACDSRNLSPESCCGQHVAAVVKRFVRFKEKRFPDENV